MLKTWTILLTAFILGIAIGIGSALVDVLLVRPAPIERFRCPNGAIIELGNKGDHR